MPKSLKRTSLFSVMVVLASTIIPIALKSDSASATGIAITAPSSINISGAGGPVCPATTMAGCPMRVSGLNSNNYLVAIKIENTGELKAQLKIASQGSVELSYGYGSQDLSAFTEISFTGTATSVNTALGDLEYISNGYSGAASITITATENIPGVAYYAKDDHFYKVGHFMNSLGGNGYSSLNPDGSDDNKFCAANAAAASYISAYLQQSGIQLSNVFTGQAVPGNSTGDPRCAWKQANHLAKSSVLKNKTGYLANITSAAENEFLRTKLAGALNVWMGGSDGDCRGHNSKTLLTGVNLQNTASLTSSCNSNPNSDDGTEGLFHWYDGPESGQVFWRSTTPYHFSAYNSRNIDFDDLSVRGINYLYFEDLTGALKEFYLWGYEPIFQNLPGAGKKRLFVEQPLEAIFEDFLYGFSLFDSNSDFIASSESYDTSSGDSLYVNGVPLSECLTDSQLPVEDQTKNCNGSFLNDAIGARVYKGYPASFNDFQSGLVDIDGQGVSTDVEFGNGGILLDSEGLPTLALDQNGGSISSPNRVWNSSPNVVGNKECSVYGWQNNGNLSSGVQVNSRFANWSDPVEPNNSSSVFNGGCGENTFQGEDNIVFNWTNPDGRWNDLNGDEPTVAYYGYIIEYGDSGAWDGVTKKEIAINAPVVRSWTITSSSGSNGNISVTGETVVTEGDDQNYIFTPTSGYRIKQVTVDGQAQGRISSYRFTNVQGNHTISVEFERVQAPPPDPGTPTPTPTPSPTVSPSPSASPSPLTSETPTSKPTPRPSASPSRSNPPGKTVPDGTVVITPTQIAELNLRKSVTGNSANLSISQLKSGQRVRVTVISKADLNTQVVNLTSVGIIKVTPGPIKPKTSVNPAMIDIQPAPKIKSSDPGKAKISISGVKKNQRVRVTVKSK